MNQAGTTWALVVGIDRYGLPRIRELKGAVRDATAAVRWLLRIGVPPNQILLHAVPCQEVKTELTGLQALGLNVSPAHEADIVASMGKLGTANNGKGGSRLFVFLAGHGYYEPGGGRIFLLQEAGMADVWTNMGIEYYTKWLRSLPFRCQRSPETA